MGADQRLVGAITSGQTESNVTARVFGSLLTWLNDHESDVFFVGTCNDASKLPPEFARAERFDGVFFVDLPGRDQKDQIWGIDTRHCGLDAKQARPDDPNWTGPRSSRAAGWRRCSISRSLRPRRMSYPWLPLQATRSRAFGSGSPVGACRLTGRACIRGQSSVEGGGGCCGSRG